MIKQICASILRISSLSIPFASVAAGLAYAAAPATNPATQAGGAAAGRIESSSAGPREWVELTSLVLDDAARQGMTSGGPAGAIAVEPLASGRLGIFISPADREKPLRVVLVDRSGKRHEAARRGGAAGKGAAIGFFQSPDDCPVDVLEKMLVEASVPVTDPEVRRQWEASMAELEKNSALPRPVIGKPYDFRVKEIKGVLAAREFRGQVVVLDFWATWCGPCIAELPKTKELYTRYHDKGLQIIGISLDDDPEVVAKFVNDKAIPWPVAVLAPKGRELLGSVVGVSAIPEYFVLDREGNLHGYKARGQLETILPSLLADPTTSTGE